MTGRISGAGQKAVLWFLLVLVCVGLGYPTVNRYDPRQAGGVGDSAEYYSLVVSGWPSGASLDHEVPRPRILVPFVARFINSMVEGHTRPADPVLLSLLIANAMFCATAALILVDLGARVSGNYAVALLAATLYLLNFAVSNYLLSGMVDSGEACLMLALAWALYTGRLFLLPAIGIIGACAKETFVPLAAAFAVAWWLFAVAPAWRNARHLGWIVAMVAAAFGAMVLLWSSWYLQPEWPWNIAIAYRAESEATFLQGLWDSIWNRGILYVFCWLVPLGLWRLNRLPVPWVAASLASALLALVLGAWENGGGNIARAMFNVFGPALSLSVALLLSGWSNKT